MRPIPVYNRKKDIRTWIKENQIFVETYFEDPVHFIILSMIVQKDNLKILDISINFLRSPYPEICSLTKEVYKKLKGTHISSGFNKKINEIVPKEKGCHHVKSLLREAADGVIQTGFYMNPKIRETDGEKRRKLLLKNLKNICLAYSDEYNKSVAGEE